MWILYILLALLTVFLVIIFTRAALFVPKKQNQPEGTAVSFDGEAAVRSLQKLVQCKTVSCSDPELEDDSEFEKFICLLPELYPQVWDACEFHRLPDRALLFRWPGKRSASPSVMMAHYDVVPADESQWDKPPFAGIIEKDVLWGRGTLDTKVTFNGILCAAEALIRQCHIPENDIYFAFSGGEEVNGPGARNIVEHFRSRGIRPALVLDEGGAVVENVFPGVKKPCGLIGIAEKGMMNVRYTVRSQGGHASAPPAKTPLTTLAKACLDVQRHPFKMRVTKPAGALFDTLGRHSGFGYKLIFANLWCFGWVLELISRKGGEMGALLRTTTAFTQAGGSNARNVLPTQASLVSNMRLSPADTIDSAMAHLKKAVNNDAVEIELLEGFEPSSVSETEGDAWDAVATTVAETWPGCIVSPYLMVQCADARHYGPISSHVYRFCPMTMTPEERSSIHGNNERIRLENIKKAVEFYIRLMTKC